MWPFKKNRQRIAYSALVDSSSRILLALSANVATIALLAEMTMDTIHISNANQRYSGRKFPPADAPTQNYPQWTWNNGEVRFVRTRPELLTKEVRDRSRLAVEKERVLGDIMKGISRGRYPASTGVLFQESVYLTKKAQAAAFKKAGYPEDDILEYPYVIQYADFANIPLRQAADDILFKARLDDELLAKTELIRLKYFNAIRSARTAEEVPPIYEAFMRESYRNALV